MQPGSNTRLKNSTVIELADRRLDRVIDSLTHGRIGESEVQLNPLALDLMPALL